jgi:alkylation response protein AidB-like acyl-CoA dehydrogenase
MGMDFLASTIVAETIGRTVVSIPYIPCIVSTVLPLLTLMNNQKVLEEIARVVNGEAILTTAFIEPGNEDPFSPLCAAAGTGEQGSITGSKHCVPYAGSARAVMVSAKNGKELTVALVAIDQPGVTLTEQLSTANEPQYHIDFDKADALILATGKAAEDLLQQSVGMTTAAICSMAVGLADKMTRISGEYTSQREQFGVAIATFQAVAHRLADCYIDTECLKIISQKAASDVNNGDFDADTLSMAKVWCGDALYRISQASQHVHGGMGIDRDYHLFRYCLWAKQLELTLGNSKQHTVELANRLEARYLATS